MIIAIIKERLKMAPQTHRVYFDFAKCVPTTVDSWRGIYTEPAIGWRPTSYEFLNHSDHLSVPTAASLLDELNKATDGRKYNGWKGGEYQYSDNSKLHVDNPGEYTNTEITWVELNSECVILHTSYESKEG